MDFVGKRQFSRSVSIFLFFHSTIESRRKLIDSVFFLFVLKDFFKENRFVISKQKWAQRSSIYRVSSRRMWLERNPRFSLIFRDRNQLFQKRKCFLFFSSRNRSSSLPFLWRTKLIKTTGQRFDLGSNDKTKDEHFAFSFEQDCLTALGSRRNWFET